LQSLGELRVLLEEFTSFLFFLKKTEKK